MARKSVKKYSTENKAKYAKEITNLKRRIRDAEKKGYSFSQEFKDSLDITPDRIGKPLIKKIHDMRREELYKNAEYELEDGIKISGERAFKDRFRTKEKREFEYQDETENKFEEVDIGTQDHRTYDYEQEDYSEYDYDQTEYDEFTLQKNAMEIIEERIDDLNWATDTDKNYLKDIMYDEFDEVDDAVIFDNQGMLSDALSDTQKYEAFKDILDTLGVKNRYKEMFEGNSEEIAHMYYAIKALRRGSGLSSDDYSFLGYMAGIYI